MQRRLLMVVLGAIVATFAFGVAPAMAADQVVDDGAECPNADFDTIQEGVDAANAGDTVTVCDGTYEEEVTISGPEKDDLVLRSQEVGGARITYPSDATSGDDLVTIDGSDDVTVRGFRIAGPYPAVGCEGEHIGVYVIGGSQRARIALNEITAMQADDPALFGCQDGFGVIVEFASTAAVALNRIVDYQKGGVVINGENTASLVAGNLIHAATEVQPSIAPNGVQVSNLAAAGVVRNAITENQCELPNNCNDFTGSGLIAFDPLENGLVVRENVVVDNDDNVPLIDTDGARIRANRIRDAVVLDGIFADDESTGNTIRDNRLSGNTEHDCHDESTGTGTGGTANTWTGNTGQTQNRSGLCQGAVVPTAAKSAEQPEAAPAIR